MEYLLPPGGTNRHYRVRIQVPNKEARDRLPSPYTGRSALIANLKTANLAEARRLARPWIDSFLDMKDRAQNVRRVWVSRPTRRLSIPPDLEMPAEVARQVCKLIQSAVPDAKISERGFFPGHYEWVSINGKESEPSVEPPAPPAPAAKVCTTEAAIQSWIADRTAVPKPKAIRNKRRKMAELFAFLNKADDLATITETDLQEYKDHLVKERGNNVARDHLIDIKALLTSAYGNHKIDSDPGGERIRLPAKRQKIRRLPFTDTEANTLLRAAQTNSDPIVYWGTQLAAHLGLITEEFSDARARDIEIVEGIPAIHIRSDYRRIAGDGDNDLKTEARTRTLPIPTALAVDFLAYVDGIRGEYGKDAPLFPCIKPDRDGLRNTDASTRLMAFIRSMGIEGRDKVFYSWRHRVSSQLENLTTPDRARYITGHVARDVHAKHYLHHPLRELLPIIDALAAPSAPQAVPA